MELCQVEGQPEASPWLVPRVKILADLASLSKHGQSPATTILAKIYETNRSVSVK